MEIHISFMFDYPTEEFPSALIAIPRTASDPTCIEGIGELRTVYDSRGDRQGAIYDALYYGVLALYPDILHVGRDIAIGIIANWIFSRAKKTRESKVEHVVLNKKAVDLDEEAIRRLVATILQGYADEQKALPPVAVKKVPNKNPAKIRKPRDANACLSRVIAPPVVRSRSCGRSIGG
jgi:hypothetical protein